MVAYSFQWVVSLKSAGKFFILSFTSSSVASIKKQLFGKIFSTTEEFSSRKSNSQLLAVFGHPSRIYPLFRQSDLLSRLLKIEIRSYSGSLGTTLAGSNSSAASFLPFFFFLASSNAFLYSSIWTVLISYIFTLIDCAN